jgi:hypothetical protein
MRLVRLADNAFRGNGEGREASAAITAAVGHVGVDAEVLPSRCEGWPFGKRLRRQERTEFLGRRETKPRQSNFLDDDGNIPGHRAPRAPERHESSDGVRRPIISLAIYCISKIDIGPKVLKANVVLATTSEREPVG